MKTVLVQIGRRTLEVEVLGEGDPSTVQTLEIQADIENGLAVKQAIVAYLQRRYWFLKDDVLEEEPSQRFELELASGVSVELTVLGSEISILRINEICEALAQFRMRLRNKDYWKVRSIQVQAEDVPNPKNGQLKRGCEFPMEGRFYLYPTAFHEQDRYRKCLPCSWLQGVTIHETTHVCLEPVSPFVRAWDAAEELSWSKTTPGTLVRHPGGFESRLVNLRPQLCPTPYAALLPDDDRAESVVALLFKGDLHQKRHEILISQAFFERTNEMPRWRVKILPRQIPKLPHFSFRCLPSSDELFEAVGIPAPQVEPRIYDVETYRELIRCGQLHGQPSTSASL